MDETAEYVRYLDEEDQFLLAVKAVTRLVQCGEMIPGMRCVHCGLELIHDSCNCVSRLGEPRKESD